MNNLSGVSGLAQGFETSSRNEGLERRCSARQAEKRARIDPRLQSLSEEPVIDSLEVPTLLSPLSTGSVSGASGPGDSPTATTATPSTSPASPPPPKKFIPRRKPLNKNGSSNFRSHLNVNVGEDLSRNRVTDLHIPSDLVSKFDNLSKSNTEKGVETGGIIAGKHMGSYFQVTHLIIPQQISASDRWEVEDERQITNLFTYNPDLTMLGLIHTHPRMESFLSSVDLHALHDYARSNPSLISIVLAPERKTAPAFCLTSFGMKEIGKCTAKGFHQHNNPHLMYKEADHTYDEQSIETQVEDLRLD